MIKPISKIIRNGQLTIPSHIRSALNMKDGDLVRFDIKDNQLVITPVSIIDKDQSYFFSSPWQKAVKSAEESIAKGQYSSYDSAEGLKKDIENA